MAELPPGFVLDEDGPKPKVLAALPPGFVLDDGPVQHAPGVIGEAGRGSSTAEYEGANSGLKGDMRAGTRLNTKLGSKVLQGASLNFADEALAGLYTPFVAASNAIRGEGPTGLGEVYDQELAMQRDQLKAAEVAHPVASVAAEIGGALMTAKVPFAIMGKAKNLGQAALAGAGTGAVMGAAAGFGSGEGGLDNRLEEAKSGAKIGGLAGVAAPILGAGISKLISPFKSSSARQEMVDALMREGVTPTAGQRTGSHALRYAESELGGQKAAEMLERQGEQFTSAALKRAGIRADRATPDVIDAAYTRIGRDFDDLASRNMLNPDQKMLADLQGVVQDYASLVPETYRAPIIQNVVDDILKTVSLRGPNGTNAVAGKSYQALRSTLDRAARGTNDPQLANALRVLGAALDDAMERSITKNNPADAGAWREARRQYRNMLTLEKAATGAGENAAMGLISPSHLRNAAVTQSRRGYARGKGDFAELARAGEAILKPLPNSGTPGRTAVRALGTSIPSLIGSGFGASAGGFPGAIAGAAAGAALPKVVGALMMSGAGQRYLSNQIASSPGLRDVVSALLISGASPGRLPSP